MNSNNGGNGQPEVDSIQTPAFHDNQASAVKTDQIKTCTTKSNSSRGNTKDSAGEGIEGTAKVCLLKSSSTVTIPVRVEDVMVEAIVDSAAQVTIISDRVFAQLKNPPAKVRSVRLDTAGRQMSMQGFIAEPIRLGIGTGQYKGPIYVAPIEQDMLFGMDLITRGRSIIDVGNGTFNYDDEIISMNIDNEKCMPTIARVSRAKRCVVPPQIR